MTHKTKQGVETVVMVPEEERSGLVPFAMAMRTQVPQTKTEERMLQERRKQEMAIEGEKVKTNHALHCTGEIHQQAVDTFHASMVHHAKISELSRGKPYEQQTNDFMQKLSTLQGQHELRIVDAGVYAIGQEVVRPMYLADLQEPEKKPNVIVRFLRGG